MTLAFPLTLIIFLGFVALVFYKSKKQRKSGETEKFRWNEELKMGLEGLGRYIEAREWVDLISETVEGSSLDGVKNCIEELYQAGASKVEVCLSQVDDEHEQESIEALVVRLPRAPGVRQEIFELFHALFDQEDKDVGQEMLIAWLQEEGD